MTFIAPNMATYKYINIKAMNTQRLLLRFAGVIMISYAISWILYHLTMWSFLTTITVGCSFIRSIIHTCRYPLGNVAKYAVFFWFIWRFDIILLFLSQNMRRLTPFFKEDRLHSGKQSSKFDVFHSFALSLSHIEQIYYVYTRKR